MNRIILLGFTLGLLSGCAELQQMHNEQVARDCQAGQAQQRGQRDGALNQRQDSNWFNVYCPVEQRNVAVHGYLQGYQAGLASQKPMVTPAIPPLAPRPQVQPPTAIVTPDYGRQIAPPGPGIVIVVPDYRDNSGRQIAPPPGPGIVMPDYNEIAERQIAPPPEPAIVMPDYNEIAERQIAAPEPAIVVPDYNELAVSPPVAVDMPLAEPLPELQAQPLAPELPEVVTFDELG